MEEQSFHGLICLRNELVEQDSYCLQANCPRNISACEYSLCIRIL